MHRGQEHSWSGHELSDLLKGEAAVVRGIASSRICIPWAFPIKLQFLSHTRQADGCYCCYVRYNV